MAVCFGGKKSKVSQTISKRFLSDKHHDFDHQQSLTNHNSHYQKTSNIPHDLSRLSANSASSSTLSYSLDNLQSSSNSTINNHYYHKNKKKFDKMDISDDNDDEDDETIVNENLKQQKKVKRTMNRLVSAQEKTSVVNADMIFYCFEILGHYLFNGKHHSGKHYLSSSNISSQLISPSITPPIVPSEPYPLFVTWLIGTEKQLRGCIGTFSPMNLAQGISILMF